MRTVQILLLQSQDAVFVKQDTDVNASVMKLHSPSKTGQNPTFHTNNSQHVLGILSKSFVSFLHSTCWLPR